MAQGRAAYTHGVQRLNGSRTLGTLLYAASASAGRYGAWLAPIVAVAVAALCCAPFLYQVSWLGDEGIWLDGADRLLHGERLYADFFEFQPPIGFWVTAWWFRLFGPSVLTAHSLALVTLALAAGFTYLACLEASRAPLLSAALTLLWAVWSQQSWPLQISHHWFTTMLSVVAGWAVLRQVDRSSAALVLIAGLASGAAGMVTQTRGALIVLAALASVLIGAQRWRMAGVLVAGVAVAPVLVVAVLVGSGRGLDAFRDMILFPAQQYSTIQSVPFGSGLPGPLAYVYQVLGAALVLLIVVRFKHLGRDVRFWSALTLAIAGLLGAFPRPDQVHLGFSLPLSLPLAAYCGRWLARSIPSAVAAVVGLALLAVCVPSLRRFAWTAESAREAALTPAARGPVALSAEERELLAALQREGAMRAFFYPYLPVLPFILDMRQVSRNDVFVPYYTSARQYREACVAVLSDAPLVVIDRPWTEEEFLHQIFPAMPSAADPNKDGLERAIATAFTITWQNKRFTILRRNTSVGVAACEWEG